MALPLKSWIQSHVIPSKKKYDINQLSTEFFFRDPTRPTYCNSNYMYSPADGIILYQKQVKSGDSIIEIKGKNYTLKEVMCDENYNEPSVVIGIFMSFYDVHVNRVPYRGRITFTDVDSIESYNFPMLALEKQLLGEAIKSDNMGYLQNNSRRINKFESRDLTYYVVQIADYDVDVFNHFVEDNDFCMQNERFSFIRWGSQCDLVIPTKYLKGKYSFCQTVETHVEAGIDPLIKLNIN